MWIRALPASARAGEEKLTDWLCFLMITLILTHSVFNVDLAVRLPLIFTKHRKRKAIGTDVDEPDVKRPGSRKSGIYGVLD